jgi:protein TonB
MFTENLVESRSMRLEARRVLILPLVAGAHAALLGALAVASVWSLRYVAGPPVVPTPSIPVALVPPPSGGGQKPLAAAERPRPRPTAVDFLAAVPLDDPVIYDAEPLPRPSGDGVIGGFDGLFGAGESDGSPFGLPDGFDIPRPPEPETGPMTVGGDICAPVRTAALAPVYPEAARKAGIQGVVLLRLTIDREGRVTDVRVLSGLPFGLTQAAAEAARRLTFRPAHHCPTGRPVACYFDLSVAFRIQ